MADVADAVAARLTEIAPEDAAGFEERAAALREALTQLDTSFERGLADCARTDVIVSHDAYGYLERYGLRFTRSPANPDTEPTPRDLARLADLVDRTEVTTVFYEPLEGPRRRGVGGPRPASSTRPCWIRSRGSPTRPPDEDYLSLMSANLAALQTANGC